MAHPTSSVDIATESSPIQKEINSLYEQQESNLKLLTKGYNREIVSDGFRLIKRINELIRLEVSEIKQELQDSDENYLTGKISCQN